MRTVLKQPPPIFFAPYPAAMPRSSLLIVREVKVSLTVPRKCTDYTDALIGRCAREHRTNPRTAYRPIPRTPRRVPIPRLRG